MPRLSPWHLLPALLFLGALYSIARYSLSDPRAHLQEEPAHPPPRSRLSLTLDANERRYQAYVLERKAAIERVGGPGMPAFTPPTSVTSYMLWDFFIPAFSCPFPVTRVGSLGDGGKWVCGLERATHAAQNPPRPCVVYSMGVDQQSSFEQAVLRQSAGCQVYGFDYTVTSWGPELRADAALAPRAHFFPYKIGAVDNHAGTPKEYSLQGIMAELGHDFVDILKIDIEGSEFAALAAILAAFEGRPLPFGQLQLEVHIASPASPDISTLGALSAFWSTLEAAGLRPFWTELNTLALYLVGGGPFFVEWSFINIRGTHALLDDRLPEYP
ncbi:methyltransferase domain-containing protein [Mycena galericulata]|nr:methyltransferase domain-containing protein [Mycena galericulata]